MYKIQYNKKNTVFFKEYRFVSGVNLIPDAIFESLKKYKTFNARIDSGIFKIISISPEKPVEEVKEESKEVEKTVKDSKKDKESEELLIDSFEDKEEEKQTSSKKSKK